MEDQKVKDRQKTLEELWEQHKHNAITNKEGTYVELDNLTIADHELSFEDPNVPGNQSLSPTKNQKRGYYFDNMGGRYRLYKGA